MCLEAETVNRRDVDVSFPTPDVYMYGCGATTRAFYYKLVYTVASIDTQCIDSNLESGRYIGLEGFSLSSFSLMTKLVRYDHKPSQPIGASHR